jgi:multidrug efflux pump subunit AcrB
VTPRPLGIAGRLASAFIDSRLTPLLIVTSILLGAGALVLLPREEEPQIVVPMIDVFVQMPGARSKEVEERVTGPLEKLIWEIPGVEYVYSTSSPGQAMAVVRFRVGENEEDSLVRINRKLEANLDRIPPGASAPLVKPRSIDDVPILAVTLSSKRYDHFTLRRIAVEVHEAMRQVTGVSEVQIIGGRRRQLRVTLDETKMAGLGLPIGAVMAAIDSGNRQIRAGNYSSADREVLVQAGGFLGSAQEVADLVVGAAGGRPVYLRDVAAIEDGPEEPVDYVFHGTGGTESTELQPAVTLSAAKRKGANATDVAHRVVERIDSLKGTRIPSGVDVSITRNYGETAAEKSNELLYHMMLAVLTVSVLIWFALGRRESGIVALAIPVTLALTLGVFYLYGYTLNRVTLFALIFSIGILVDDAIVVVENIVRHSRLPENAGRPLHQVAVEAVDEVGNPTILATFAVIAAILPMAFVRGLMGPYMRPIPIGATSAMLFSLIVAFVVTPWASVRLLRRAVGGSHDAEGWTTRIYRRVMTPLITRRMWRWSFLAAVVILLLGSLSLVMLRAVKVKMLPFDNKSEFQVIVDMPEGSTLEQTAAATRRIADYVHTVPEVADYQLYVGTAAPYNFNGLVRHYYLRRGANVADIQVNLRSRGERQAQSHDVAKRVRGPIQDIARQFDANVKIAEVPPGPPVLQTLVAEIYGPDYARQIEVASTVKQVLENTDGVVDVDWYVEDLQPEIRLRIDREKAALLGVSSEQAASALRLAVGGSAAGLLHDPRAKEDVPITLRLDEASRSSAEDLKRLRLAGSHGLVPLSEIANVETGTGDRSIYHKNLMPVVYVTADVAGAEESPVYAILKLNAQLDGITLPEGYALERYVANQPATDAQLAMKWDGEWHISYEVFRDLGLAFAVVLVLIYVLVTGWFQSFRIPLTIMSAIPFSLVGILPAHAGMGAFFTATSMIGFIAGAGIVVRNSIILVDFIQLRIRQGMPLAEAVVDAGAVRFRPMVLTAAAVIAGAGVILFDPIFQGLAISLMAGEVASLLLSRMTVPILFYLSESRNRRATESVSGLEETAG